MYNGVHFSLDGPDPANIRVIDHGALGLISKMTTRGIRVDVPFLRTLDLRITTRQREIEESIPGILGNAYTDFDGKRHAPFSIGSPDHVARLLFKHLELAKPGEVKLTKGKKREAVDDDVLSLLENRHLVVPAISEWRELNKLHTTYTGEDCIIALVVDGRVHTDFTTTVAATGRLSSRRPNCFTGDTEILTEEGWVPFCGYKGERIAQWEDGSVIRFVKPTGFIKRKSHNLVRLYNQHTDIACTEDHRCLLFNRKNGKQIVVPASKYLKDAKQLHAGFGLTGVRLVIDDCELQFLVAAQADGSVTKLGWDFSFKKERKIKRFREILKNCKFVYREIPKNKLGRVRFYVRDENGYARRLLGINKKFGNWLLQMNGRQRRLFCDELWFWDGCWTRRNHYASCIESNSDWVQTMLVLDGCTANKRRYVSQGGSVSWQVDVTRRDYTLTANTKKERLKPQMTYCVSVPSSFLVVRRNGKVSVTGNCQNIPTRTPLGAEVRNAFIADPGWRLLSVDLSQIEMRWAAHRSKDATMMSVFWNKEDVHTRTTCNVFGLDYKDVAKIAAVCDADMASPEEVKWYKAFKKEKRLPCKTVGFGVLYGQSEMGLQSSLATEGVYWTEDECKDLIENKFFAVYPGLRDMLARDHATARRYAMIWDDFGRVRLVPEAKSTHRWISDAGIRKAGNHPEQSGSQNGLKLAMAELNDVLLPDFEGYLHPLLQIHDEIIWGVHPDVDEQAAFEVTEIMKNAVPLDVPVESSSDIAERWGELK